MCNGHLHNPKSAVIDGTLTFGYQKEAIPFSKGHHKKTPKQSLLKEGSKDASDANQTGSATR